MQQENEKFTPYRRSAVNRRSKMLAWRMTEGQHQAIQKAVKKSGLLGTEWIDEAAREKVGISEEKWVKL